MKQALIKLGLAAAGLLVIALYVSLLMKADLGTSAYDALSRTGGLVLGLRMGTVSILLNTVLIACQALMLGRQVQFKLLSQFFIVFGFGLLVNWFYYDLFAGWELTYYVERLALLAAGIELKALGMLILFKAEFICCPIDGFCLELSKKLRRGFDGVRQGVEIICIALVCLITLAAGSPWTVREGTLIDAALIGPALAINRWLIRKFKRVPKAAQPFS